MCVIKALVMNNYDPELIKEIISSLRSSKTSVFYNKNDGVDFKSVVETCRIIDAAMLPLFFIWEYCCHRQLSEICMEEHLRIPYEKFLRDPIANTFEFYFFLRIGVSCSMPVSKKNKVLSIYERILMLKKEENL